jgi:hypothetical protein
MSCAYDPRVPSLAQAASPLAQATAAHTSSRRSIKPPPLNQAAAPLCLLAASRLAQVAAARSSRRATSSIATPCVGRPLNARPHLSHGAQLLA